MKEVVKVISNGIKNVAVFTVGATVGASAVVIVALVAIISTDKSESKNKRTFDYLKYKEKKEEES